MSKLTSCNFTYKSTAILKSAEIFGPSLLLWRCSHTHRFYNISVLKGIPPPMAVPYTIMRFQISPKNILVQTNFILPLIFIFVFTIVCSRKYLNSPTYETKN